MGGFGPGIRLPDIERLIGLLDERITWRGLATRPMTMTGTTTTTTTTTTMATTIIGHRCARIEVRYAGSSSDSSPAARRATRSSSPRYAIRSSWIPGWNRRGRSPLHRAYTFRQDRVVLIQDYPDRASARTMALRRAPDRSMGSRCFSENRERSRGSLGRAHPSTPPLNRHRSGACSGRGHDSHSDRRDRDADDKRDRHATGGAQRGSPSS